MSLFGKGLSRSETSALDDMKREAAKLEKAVHAKRVKLNVELGQLDTIKSLIERAHRSVTAGDHANAAKELLVAGRMLEKIE